MSNIARRPTSAMSDLLEWFESRPLRDLGLTQHIRVEDFVEDQTYVLRAEMPGIDPEKDVEVSIDGDVLTIKGERREETKEKNRNEFHYGAFARSIPLPRGVKASDVVANYTDGVLEVRVPIREGEATPSKIPVQRTDT